MSTTEALNVTLNKQLCIKFRKFCSENLGLNEENRRSLICSHDSTIRFTNSTTSVLKPYIGSEIPESGFFLIQPAMGQQGLVEWNRSKTLGPYSSYFNSLGTLQSPKYISEAAQASLLFFKDILGINYKNLLIRISCDDRDIQNIFLKFDTRVKPDQGNLSDYRHRYGTTEYWGRNANFLLEIDGKTYKNLGNFTLIESAHSQLAVEISFDSTSLLSGIHQLQHPILSLPAAPILLAESDQNGVISTEDLVTIDFMNTSLALMIEGLKPKARGREGNLRNFIRAISNSHRILSMTEKDIERYSYSIIKAETEISSVLSPAYSDQVSTSSADDVVSGLISEIRKAHSSKPHP